MDYLLALVVLLLGILIGIGFFYILFLVNKKATDEVLEERGLGRRLK